MYAPICHMNHLGTNQNLYLQTLPKAQRTWGLSSEISTKYKIQNLNQTSAFWPNLTFKILTKPGFRILTNIKLHLPQPSISSKMLTKLSLQNLVWTQNLDQTLWSRSKQKFAFLTKLQLPNLYQTVADTFLSINISTIKTSRSLSWHLHMTGSHQ